jgi:PDZ domain-containing protein
MVQPAKSRRKKRIWAGILFLFIASLFIPTPYYIFQPGSVEELSAKVSVENGDPSAAGKLYLTTVLSMKASNIYYLAYGLLAPHADVERSTSVKGDMTDQEYDRWLAYLMKSSQENAVAAGLKAAGEEVAVHPKGVIVQTVSSRSKAKWVLEAGDIIKQVDRVPVRKSSDLFSYLKGKRAGDVVTVAFSRDGNEKRKHIELIPLVHSEIKAGLGIVLSDYTEVETSRKVKMEAGEIGGPSAGLMFALEVFRQLQQEDITKGYHIAGTGTISRDGKVGQIGGIREKIAAVDEADMDIFFCPKDIKPGDTNEKDVLQEAEKYDYEVKIVPVETLEEAIGFLQKLPPKQ